MTSTNVRTRIGQSLSTSASNTGSQIGIFRQKTNNFLEFYSLSAGSGVGIQQEDLVITISAAAVAGGAGGVPYDGATASVNLASYGLSAGSISSGAGITGTTLSANLLLAGNFQTITASLQTQVGSLWNAKVPYNGATANVNLISYSFTANTISAINLTANTITAVTITSNSISSLTLSAGGARISTLWFGDGSNMTSSVTGLPPYGANNTILVSTGSGTMFKTLETSSVNQITINVANPGRIILGTPQDLIDTSTPTWDGIHFVGGAHEVELWAKSSTVGRGLLFWDKTSGGTAKYVGLRLGGNISTDPVPTSFYFDIPKSDGAANTVLKTDGAGGLGFMAVSAGNVVPYYGATANLNLASYNLTAGAISTNDIFAGSISANASISSNVIRATTFWSGSTSAGATTSFIVDAASPSRAVTLDFVGGVLVGVRG